MTDTSLVPATSARPPVPVWLTATIAGAFGLLYAYALWNAVAFLIDQAGGPLGLNGLGWFVLLLPVVFPLIVFAAAFAIGYRRGAWQLALAMLAGLCVVALFWLNIVGYAAVYGAQLLGG